MIALKKALKKSLFWSQRDKKKNFRLFLESIHNSKGDVLNKPLQLFLEVTTQCNLRCQKCGKNFDPSRQKTHHIPFELLSQFHDYYKGAIEVNTFGYGEMFLYKNLRNLVEILKAYDCKLSGITNGTMINQEEIAWLIGNRYDELTFSIDGATTQTMKRLRGADLNKIITTLQHIKEEKQKRKRKVPRVIINFVAEKDNFHELPDLIRIVSELDIYLIGVNTLHYFSGPGPEDTYGKFYNEHRISNMNWEDFETILNESHHLAEKAGIQFYCYINLDVEWQRKTGGQTSPPNGNPSKDQALAPFYCLFPWTTLYLAADQSTKVCCFMEENLGRFSNSKHLDEIWHGQGPFAEIRNSIQRGLIHPACKVCVMQGNYRPSHSFVEAIKDRLT